MGYSEIFSKRIKDLCKSHGITINHLAAICGLKQSTIDNIIHGASKNPQIKTLHKIASAFNMTLCDFMDFPELNDYDPEEDDAL